MPRYAQNPLDTFPRSFPAADLLATRRTILTCQDVANKSATSWQQVVVMEFVKRHHDTQTQRTFARANLLRTLLQTC